ncbi:MAG: hypothetical protein MUE81_00655 [Thermoflexibacter sp.]|jgi:hypothetical protein|nr:hypothetical protein [Thermoflexibacter sp.]
MEVATLPSIKTEQKQKNRYKQDNPNPKPQFFWVIMILFGTFAVFMTWIVYDDDGNPDIDPARKVEIDDYARRLESAEQYALIAKIEGYYPCESCEKEKIVFLKAGEVWKYGVTINGEKGRYPKGLPDSRLRYFGQFIGNLVQCLVEEKRKIIYYPILPENLAREIKLKRPPGNPQDR